MAERRNRRIKTTNVPRGLKPGQTRMDRVAEVLSEALGAPSALTPQPPPSTAPSR